MRLEHVGIASSNVAAALATLETVLGVTPYKTETVAREGVRTTFLDTGAKLELLEALGPDSPVAKFLDKRGEGLHHLAFQVDDVDAALVRLREAGLPLLAEQPKTGADGKRIFFVHPRATHGVLVELCGDDPDALPAPEQLDVPGGAVAAYRFGDAHRPAVVVLHGAAGSTRLETLPLCRLLEPAFHVVALDLPGHGGSPRDAPISFEATQAALLAALDALGLDRPHLWGYSFGGAMALLLAAHHPDRVDRVAVHATSLVWNDATLKAMLRRLQPEVVQRRAPAEWARFEAAHGPHAEAVFARVAAFSAHLPAFAAHAPAVLAAVQAPAFVSAGDGDELFPLGQTLAHRDALRALLCILPGVRHAFTPETARALAPHLITFLRE